MAKDESEGYARLCREHARTYGHGAAIGCEGPEPPRYKFSIVMSVYNVEPYIDEAFESLVAQTIGFEGAVQVVLVNDGSADGSGAKCEGYARRFPRNVTYVEKKNGGLSSARNEGLRHVDGELVNFLDPDDVLPPNVLEEVWRFHGRNPSVRQIAIPLYHFGQVAGIHGKYLWMGDKNRVIDLRAEPYNFVLSAASSFYRREAIQGMSFAEDMVGAEDSLFNYALYAQDPRIGYVCERGVRYLYRKRASMDSITDGSLAAGDTRVWESAFTFFERSFTRLGELGDLEQELIAYELRSRVRDARRAAFATREDYDSFMGRASLWAGRLDADFVLRRGRFLQEPSCRAAFLWLRGDLRPGTLGERDLRSILLPQLCTGRVHRDCATLEMVVWTFGLPFELVAIDSNGAIARPVESRDLSSAHDCMYGELELDVTHYRRFELPLRETSYRFAFVHAESGRILASGPIETSVRPPFMNQGRVQGVVRHGFRVSVVGDTIVMEPRRQHPFVDGIVSMFKLRTGLRPHGIFRPFALPKKRFVLISDRPQKAGDNGEALFRYMMEHAPADVRRRTFYVLDHRCPDYKRMESHHHVVQHKGLIHRILFLNAAVVASSHHVARFFCPLANAGRSYADLLDYRFVWLQHGVTHNDVSLTVNRISSADDLVTVASEREAQEFLRAPYFYEERHVARTGFARYDLLENRARPLVVVMPTWRSHLSGAISATGFHEPLSGFEESEYFRMWHGFLADPGLRDSLRAHGAELLFVLHPGTACYEDSFADAECDVIRLVHQRDVVYRDLFATASLLVTDYSSVTFDFAYLRKPVVYFYFDEDEFFGTHYHRGYFDARRDGFGPVVTRADELVDEVGRFVDDGFQMPREYRERVNDFFLYDDKGSCARIAERIYDLLDGGERQ